MKISGQIFQNSMIPATGAILLFMFNIPLGGWCLTGVACIGFLVSFLVYRKEKKGGISMDSFDNTTRVKKNAPDKIYLGIQDMGTGYVYALSLDNNGEQEYIRKDALLEWAKECFRLQDSGSWYSKGAADAFSKLIDKLNEM